MLTRSREDEGLFKELTDRPIGGLGIMLAKDGVDDLQYESYGVGECPPFHCPFEAAA